MFHHGGTLFEDHTHPQDMVDTGYLADRSVTAAKLATSFPQGTLGYAAVTTNQTGITAEADLIGLTVTVTVPASRRLRITGQAQVIQQGSIGNIIGRIKEDSTELNRFLRAQAVPVGGLILGHGDHIVTPSAGTHTYKLTLTTSAGTVDTSTGTTVPAFILVEDITALTASQPIAVPTGLWRASADFPASPSHGDLFYETDTDKLWAWNGTDWVEMGRTGAWTDFTPGLTQQGAVPHTITHARWSRIGRTITAQVFLTVSGAGGVAGQPVILGWPVATLNARRSGTGAIYDSSANIMYNGIAEAQTATSGFRLWPTSIDGGNVLGVVVFTAALAVNDQVHFNLMFEAAASV